MPIFDNNEWFELPVLYRINSIALSRVMLYLHTFHYIQNTYWFILSSTASYTGHIVIQFRFYKFSLLLGVKK